MKTILHKAETRGHANHGWLDTYHTFSFANYYEPTRIHFGALRVLNDDTVAGGKGFDTHPHDNMEIISIPLEGDLLHKDSMGNKQLIKFGDVQVMSAGTGVLHSEYNNNYDKQVKFLQIWVFSDKRDVEPRYDQMSLNVDDRHNKLQLIVAPTPGDHNLWVHQQTWFHMGNFDKGQSVEYVVKRKGNGVYAFVLEGKFKIGDQELDRRDGLGVWEVDKFTVSSLADNSQILLMDVPME